MKFQYCPHCGNKLVKKEIGDEGFIPFCENCDVPLWDMFTTSIIAAVVNEEDEIALLKFDATLSLLREGSIAWCLVKEVIGR